MNEEIERIVGDLEALLETIKIKPVVVSESKAKTTLTEDDLAPQLTSAVFRELPKGASSEDASYCLSGIAQIKAEELGLSKRKLIEAVLNYCLDISESLTAELESNDLVD